jgi:hypothetical protein
MSTLTEVQTEKRELEQKLLMLIQNFETKHDVSVSSVYTDCTARSMEQLRSRTWKLELRVEI